VADSLLSHLATADAFLHALGRTEGTSDFLSERIGLWRGRYAALERLLRDSRSDPDYAEAMHASLDAALHTIGFNVAFNLLEHPDTRDTHARQIYLWFCLNCFPSSGSA
jgi:hypothetical protein